MTPYLSHPRHGVYVRPRWNGAFRIPPGTVSKIGNPTNTPVRRRVVLHHQASTTTVREGWSDPITGAHTQLFEYIPAGTYYMVSFDHTGEHGPASGSDIVAEPMP